MFPKFADILDTSVKFADILDTTNPDEKDIEVLDYDHYGLPTFKYDGAEYAIGTDRMATIAAKTDIRESVWAFNANFLVTYMPQGITEATIKTIQEGYESSNDAIWNLIRNKTRFIQDAILSDGRGHFISHYDGEENELNDIGLTIEDLPPELLRKLKVTKAYQDTLYVYRIN